jgi:hypothetical protein
MNIGFESPEQLSLYMQDFKYKDFDALMSASDVGSRGEGSCHDQTLYIYNILDMLGLDPKAKFLMAVDKDNVGEETHSFVYWLEDDSAYWFENAWEDYKGIHEFKSEQDLLDFVSNAFAERNPHKYIYMSSFNPTEHEIGEDLGTFVDICMNDAEPIM